MTDTQEQILGVPRSVYQECGEFEGFIPSDRGDLGVYLQEAPKRNASFYPRGAVETDDSVKQLIPYCVILHRGSVLTYRRGGSEGRLDGQLSIGIGGHINDSDDSTPFLAYGAGILRELKEEIGLEVGMDEVASSCIGFVNDEQNPVGRVHLGVVHVFQVDDVDAASILENHEDAILDPKFIPITEFCHQELVNELETWSRYVVDHLIDEIPAEDGPWTDQATKNRLQLMLIASTKLAQTIAVLQTQSTTRGYQVVSGALEEAVGQVHCMVGGLIQMGDVSATMVQEMAKKHFHDMFGTE